MRSPYRANARANFDEREPDVVRFARRVGAARGRRPLIAVGLLALAGLVALVPLAARAPVATPAGTQDLGESSGLEWPRRTGRLPVTARLQPLWPHCCVDYEACDF